ncbi:ATP-binding protein [Spiroplasma floricola]|uniref:ATP-binding protein n=1 Tax=Spiroplasma floricola 23-6 TaxID=1336749 RepID=A0A2K8SE68_9MOLU|nr:ATP-binding protein [Spiroplasma floricola]AUB31739.1 hypothetical protein SFLOR_v1c06910 [Spiroplasma floricola 23-6]
MSKINENEIPRTNREFLGYIDKTTSHIYMISEFIDNSIQSAIDNNFEYVEVKIIVNMLEKAIYIIDNAAGIAYKNRSIAIRNGKDESEQGNSLNMFGVGMKMAAIWFGKRLRIFTKSIEDDFPYMINLDIDKLKGKNFNFYDTKDINIKKESGIQFNYDHGTIIKIDKFHIDTVHSERYEKRMFNKGTKNEGKALEEQLACRYSRYIKKNFLSINMSYINEDGDEEMPNKVPVEITKSKIPDMYIKNSKERQDYEFKVSDKEKININKSKFYIKSMKEIKNAFADSWNNVIEGLEDITYGMIIEKFENQEELKFKTFFRLPYNYYENERIPFTFGFIGNNSSLLKYNGLTVYQDDRAIISGPNSEKSNLTWLSYPKALSDSSYKVTKRFIGEIDLNNKKIFRVDNNKMGFHGTVKEDIEKTLSDIFKNYLSPLFDKILDIIFYKNDQLLEDKLFQQEIDRFANEINKNKILENHSVITEELKINDTDGERFRNGFIVVNEKEESAFKIVCHPEGQFGNKHKLFKTRALPCEDNSILFVIVLNKEFYGFKNNLKDEHFSILFNPLIKLLMCELIKYKTNQEKNKRFKELIEGIEGE